MEQGFYAQVVVLRRKYLKFTEANKNKNDAKFKFQGQSARSQRWFDFYFYWVEVHFSTREPDLYRKLFQIHDNTQDTDIFKIFQVPIGSSKYVENFKFHSDAPILKYRQKSFDRCCLSSLEYSFAGIKQTKADNAVSLRIEKSLKIKVVNRIDFTNSIFKNEYFKGEPRVYYSLRKYKKMGYYDILKYRGDNFTLVQLMDSLGNVNHAISFLGYCIFDSNYERELVLNIESLGIICAPSVGEE